MDPDFVFSKANQAIMVTLCTYCRRSASACVTSLVDAERFCRRKRRVAAVLLMVDSDDVSTGMLEAVAPVAARMRTTGQFSVQPGEPGHEGGLEVVGHQGGPVSRSSA